MTPRRIEPGPGQESVWDYPRPPIAVAFDGTVRIEFNGQVVAETTSAIRVLETSQAPAYYLPPADVALDLLVPIARQTGCEWKGRASYVDVVVGDRRAAGAGWRYDTPTDRFASIAGYYAFYAQSMDRCQVDDHVVEANGGDFYGGWITPNVVGPFKGAPGTAFW